MKELLAEDFNILEVIKELEEVGAISVPILSKGFRLKLLREALDYIYTPQEEVVGREDKRVHQQIASFNKFSDESNFLILRDLFEDLLNSQLGFLDQYPFSTNLNFNNSVLQKYEQGSIGITPHMDGKSNINLVSVFVIGGAGRFFVCSDRAGSNPKEIDATAGNVIIMRAPGFLNSDFRPFHCVCDISKERYIFGLRQKQIVHT